MNIRDKSTSGSATANDASLDLVHSTPTLSPQEKLLLDKEPDSIVEAKLDDLQCRLSGVHDDEVTLRAQLQLEIAGLLLDLDRKSEAYDAARPLVEIFVVSEKFEDAALACQYTYLADNDESISALGHGAWLAVTYPIDPGLTANILNHIVDETPDDADGAAVAAATAHYVADVRQHLSESNDATLFTAAMLAQVAKRHSNVQSEDEFIQWVRKLELDQPEKFLIRLRNVIDVLVQEDWWFDRDELRRQIDQLS